ncbi:cell separation during budding, partial [Spiromyces aspiralis]
MKAGDLVRGQEVIQVNSDTTVEEVCEVLIRHQISSVPIYDQQKGMYIGFFDLHDLCTYLLLLARAGPEKRRIKMFGKCLSENASTNGAEPPAPFSSQRSFRRRSSSLSMSSTIDSDDFAERFVAGRGSNSPVGTPTHRKSYASSDMPYARRENSGISLMSAVDLAASPNSELEVLARKIADQEPIPVKMLSDISTSNPFCSVLPETSIIQIMELFSMGTHRIAVIDGDGKFVGILTQSRLIQSVYDNMDHVSELSRILDTS